MLGAKLFRKQEFTGYKKRILSVIVCCYLGYYVLKLGASLFVGEGELLIILRSLSLALSLCLGYFVWKGYALARFVLATSMTGLGIFCLYVVMKVDVVDAFHMPFLIVGVLWSLFGLTLFSLNRFGSATGK